LGVVGASAHGAWIQEPGQYWAGLTIDTTLVLEGKSTEQTFATQIPYKTPEHSH